MVKNQDQYMDSLNNPLVEKGILNRLCLTYGINVKPVKPQ
jgi:hypothetical protein